MENRFNVDGISYTATAEVLPPETDWRYIVSGHWQHQSLVKSAKFLQERNAFILAAQKKKLNLLQYYALLLDSDRSRRSNFLDDDVSGERRFEVEVEDGLGITRKVSLRGETEIEELEAPNLITAYRTLEFGNDEFTDLVVRRLIAHQQQGVHPPLPYTNPEEFQAFLKTIDLRNDTKRICEFIEALTETARKFEGCFITDEAERLRVQCITELPEITVEWEKKAADPFTTPAGSIVGEQTGDTRLQAVLNELAEEAYMTAQIGKSKKSNESFFTLLKRLFGRTEAKLAFPEDVALKQ